MDEIVITRKRKYPKNIIAIKRRKGRSGSRMRDFRTVRGKRTPNITVEVKFEDVKV